MKFLERARWLYRIVLVQHATRQILRAAWLGGAVYLFCWGANSLWGVLPRPGYWVLFSVLVGFANLLTIFGTPIKMKDFLWRVDNRFSQREQLSTAYQVAQEKSAEQDGAESLGRLLLADAAEILPGIIRRVIDLGWKLRNDVEATIIVLTLLLIVYLSGMESFSTTLPGEGLLLPGAGSDPSYFDIYASGIPGDTSGIAAPGPGLRNEGTSGLVEGQTYTANGLDLVYSVFREMGTQLKDNATTADFGRALEDGDFEEAANQLGNLSENVDRLTVGTRQKLADAFSYGVRELYVSEYSNIREPLGDAVSALEEGPLSEMSVQLDRVADMLNALASQLHGDVYTLDEYIEPITERLEGEGEEVELDSPEDVSGLLVSPGGGAAGSGDVIGEVIDLTGVSSESTGEYNISAYDFSWEDKDVVSSYFSPR